MTTSTRQDLNVRLDGVQGTLAVGAEERDGDQLVWITTEPTGSDDGGVSIGVSPADLLAAIEFVLGGTHER